MEPERAAEARRAVVASLFKSNIKMFHDLPKRSAEFIIVHIWLAFLFPPSLGNCIWVDEMKLSLAGEGSLLTPGNEVSIVIFLRVGQHLQEKLPQLHLTGSSVRSRKKICICVLVDF